MQCSDKFWAKIRLWLIRVSALTYNNGLAVSVNVSSINWAIVAFPFFFFQISIHLFLADAVNFRQARLYLRLANREVNSKIGFVVNNANLLIPALKIQYMKS